MPEQSVVWGTVNDARQRPVVGYLVRAYDEDLPSLGRDEYLGASTTDREGRYRISYETKDFGAREHTGADVYIEVFDRNNSSAGRSATRYNCGTDEQIDVTVRQRDEESLTEYEQLLALIDPLIEPLSPAYLTDEDVEFLVGETAADERHLSWISAATLLAENTGASPEAFYGWARCDPPLPQLWNEITEHPDDDARQEILRAILRRLAETATDELIQGLVLAAERRIIPNIRDRIEETIAAVRRAPTTSHHCLVRLLTEDAAQPLSGIRVRTTEHDAAQIQPSIHDQTTTGDGMFAITVTAEPTEAAPLRRNITVALLDSADAEYWSTEIVALFDSPDVLELRAPTPHLPEPADHHIDRLGADLGLEIPDELRIFLTEHDIHTLADIRLAGGMNRIDALPLPADDPVVHTLRAHADLARLSPDVSLNAILIEHGFSSVTDIARVPAAGFVAALHEQIGDFAAAKLHVEARAQDAFLRNVLTDLATDQANGFAPSSASGDPSPADTLDEHCGCHDCEAAVSPAAFLAELIGYVATHVKQNGAPVDVAYLESTFHQPFGSLPTDCQAIDELVRQVRICIEVLRSYLHAHPSDAATAAILAEATRRYLFTAYSTVLARLGTSYDEVRLARTADEGDRHALADRLGIDLSEPRPDPVTTDGDELDQLFLDPGVAAGAQHALTESTLERLCGLADTTRDPLCDGIIYGEVAGIPELARWSFTDIVWSHNTDADGFVYLTISTVATAALHSEVKVYRDSARTQLVAAGVAEAEAGPRTVNLVAKNASGLNGTVTVSGMSPEYDGVSVALVPKLVAWRLRRLGTVWRDQDFPVDAYSDDADDSQRRPIIDPDVIGPDDFRHPLVADPAFALWRQRRAWVDQQLTALSALTKTIGTPSGNVTVPDLDAILAHMYTGITYEGDTLAAWVATTPVGQFEALAEVFDHGTTDAVGVAAKRVADDLCLSVDAFTEMVKLRTRQGDWEHTPNSDQVPLEDWQQLFSVLAGAIKQRFRPSWIVEEHTDAVHLDPQTFWPAVRAPREGSWPPVIRPGQPLIDPELLKPVDLPEPTIGADAAGLYDARRAAINAVVATLKTRRETTDFDAMMREALGHPAVGAPLEYSLDTLRADLASVDPVVVAAAADKVVNRLHLSIDAFNRVLAMRDQAAPGSPRPPAAADWNELYATLATAHKVKHLYPTWVTEETTNGMRDEYWRALKVALPLGRVSTDERTAWQAALATRSRPALIDPDLIAVDLIAADAPAAQDIWQARATWITAAIASLAGRPRTSAGLDAMITDTLSSPVTALVTLDDARRAGEAIATRLGQIPLTNAAFVYLMRIRALLMAAQPVTDTEWNAVYSILTQVQKQRLSAQWRQTEHDAGVTVSPDFFTTPAPAPAAPPDPEKRWRINQDARYDWLDTLTSRHDQQLSLLAGMRDDIDTTEEAVLPLLRDALVVAAGLGSDLVTKGAWLTDRLLLDTQAGGCQHTTRIAAAVETLQALLFSVRSGQSTVLQTLHLTMDAPDFDEEIRWLGSYATFRAAMFVFMYPENIAAPNLRRRQSPAFRSLIKELRGGSRLTSEQACALAAEYASYYEDVAKVSIGASAQTTVPRRTGTSCVPGVIQQKPTIFLFGRGGISQRLMFSTYDPFDTTGYAQSFWDYVPGPGIVAAVLGVAIYEPSATDRRIFLFVRTTDYKLQFLTYNLLSGQWQGPTDLALPPGDPRSLDIVVDQNNFLYYMPRLTIRSGSDFYFRTLSPDGTGWADGDWKNYLINNTDANLVNITNLYAQVDGQLLVRESRQLEWRNPGPPQIFMSGPAERNDAEYRGAVYWAKAKNAFSEYVVAKKSNGVMYADHFVTGSTPLDSDFSLAGLRYIAPNCGFVEHASYAYERRSENQPGVKPLGQGRERDGVYLRLVDLEPVLSDSPIHSHTHRIAPQVLPSAVGQFNIPARVEGAAADVRRNTVKLVMAAASDSLTNRAYAEEAYFFVPMLLADALRRAGEYVAALDRIRTVLDYTAPAANRKIYYGLVEEESLPDTYKLAADWLRDPLDPHAIAASRRLTYTRATMQTAVRVLLEFGDDEYTRDTSESVPRARNLYLQALSVLDSAELKQHLGSCDDIIGEIDIPLGPAVPPKISAGVGAIKADLGRLKNYAVLAALTPKVSEVLHSDAEWTERLTQARVLVDDALAAQPPAPTVGDAMRIGADAHARATAALLTSRAITTAAQAAGRSAGTALLSSVAAAAQLSHTQIESPATALPWLRTNLQPAYPRVDYVLSDDLRPIALAENPSLAGLFNPPSATDRIIDRDMLRPFPRLDDLLPKPDEPGPRPLPPPSPVKSAPGPSLAFCIPPNPNLAALRLHAELNLYKMRTCRNIAGMKRELDPYVAPTDTVSGLPTIGANGQLVLPGTTTLRPTLYRFDVLVARAKELVGLAAQLEAGMLAALERRDAEAYSMLRARQDLDLAQAGVQLETLRVKQANDGVTLAALQQARAQLQLDHYEKLLDEGLSELENSAIDMLGEAAALQATAATWSFAAAAVYGAAAVAGAVAGGVAGSAVAGPMGTIGGGAAGAVVGALSGGLGGIASAFSAISAGYSSNAAKRQTRAQIALTLASFERRRQEWELSASLAKQDVAIGVQQVTIANDTVDVAKQQKLIADIRNSQAKDVVAFLANKFTNADLYDWMSDILEGVYGFFLQQATSTARLAETQLAFERQEPLAALIGNDYWQTPDDSIGAAPGASAPDRRGLTGSARLLEDLYRLDQYAFETNKRKLQLSKTISLALTVPTEFQALRETGVMRFGTPMSVFDRDFPGQFLRLIRSVRLSVVALVPPVEGIHATLASTGMSRVVIGPDIFRPAPVRRDPELVALTSPVGASGVFDLDAQNLGMLAPFEGSGVDTSWELRMPKAANFFDYRSVADVLMTIDYTALHSYDYSQQVIENLRQSISGERPFSFRNQLPDQWYELHNPDQSDTPMVVRFQTTSEDFPPNIDALRVAHVVLHFARRDGTDFEVPVSGLRFTDEQGGSPSGGAVTTIDGTASTRRGNAGSWMAIIGKAPSGVWELALPNTEEMRRHFTDDDIEDILFVVTYSGRTHEWPA